MHMYSLKVVHITTLLTITTLHSVCEYGLRSLVTFEQDYGASNHALKNLSA